MQKEQQRAATDEVEDHECGQRPERVHVVGTRETAAPPQRLPDAAALEKGGRNREPGEGEPGERGEDEDPDDHANRQEDDDADQERGQERPTRGTSAGGERTGPDEGEREKRSGEHQQRCLDFRHLADRKLVESRNDSPQRQRRKEPAPVEPNRLGHELPDRAVRG